MKRPTVQERMRATPITAQGMLAYSVVWPLFEPAIRRFARLCTDVRAEQEDLIEDAMLRLWYLDPSRYDFRVPAVFNRMRAELITCMFHTIERVPKRLLTPEMELAREIAVRAKRP